MRARNREVNIFNMSLLDVLCGALGAFCFMMLVLFPYWKPKGATAEEIQKKYQQMSQEMNQIKKQLDNVPGGGDLKQRLDNITRNYQEQQRELQKAKAENDQLQMRRPMAVTLNWASASHKVDLYLRFRGKTKGGSEMEAPDPSKDQGSLFAGDLIINCYMGPCSDTWVIRDVPRGGEFEVYYKFMDASGNPAPAQITAVFVTHQGGFWSLPAFNMPQPKSVAFVGVLRFDANEKLVFLPQPEYAANFQERNKDRLAQQK